MLQGRRDLANISISSRHIGNGSRKEIMRVVLEVRSGPVAGKKVWLRPGQTVEVGRTERSEFVVAQDPQLSSRHFAIDCDSEKCRIRDLDSTNGTRLNGEQITEAILRDGDQIFAGQTKFVVRVEGPLPLSVPAPSPSQVAYGSDVAPRTHETIRPPSLESAPSAPLLPPKPTVVRPTLSRSLVITPPYDQGLIDDEAAVRGAAILAAAWTRQPWLLDYCRQLAQSPAPAYWDAILLLAILGKPSDLDRILTVGRTVQLGPKRYEVLGIFGHPGVIDTLLKRIESQDPISAPAAGKAFTKITGTDITSEKTVLQPEKEMTDPTEETELVEVGLPDTRKAWEHWREVRSKFARGTRWCRGFDLSQGTPAEVLAQLDMESRWQACLRGRFEGTWNGRPIDLEVFPHGRR